ncbi:MAG: response regulator [Deltaproteobacteria bacterium]|nr:response regulator [Deltaproteobacteria bacterium]MBN2674682.1 response regulator [Deltaproteobacteria bacterium]
MTEHHDNHFPVQEELISELNALRSRVDGSVQTLQTHDEVNVNEAALNAIINALPGLVSVVDTTFHVLVANDEVVARFGQGSLSEVLGKKCYRTRKGLDEPCPQCGVLKSFQSGETVVRTSTPDEEALMGIATKAYAVPLKDKNGEIWGGVEVIVDVTDLRNAERLARQKDEELHHARKMDALGQLAGGVAHDFNNMLAGMMGYADILHYRLADNPELQRYADKILQTATRASDLSRKLLSFSRKGNVVSETFNAHEAIHAALDLLTSSIDRRIEIKREFMASHAWVHGDRSELENAVLNLGINARDAMPDGGTITVRTCDESEISEPKTPIVRSSGKQCELENCLCIEVIDTGIGIPEDVQHRIFEPFFTTKAVGEGTGLGLAAVYGTVVEFNGTITVFSEKNLGTTFHIRLPVAEKISAAKSQRGTPVPPVGQGTILVVDDEKVVLEVAQSMLTSLGYCVVTAMNGQEALDVFRQHPVDCVVLDLVMPVMNGEDTFAALREMEANIPVLISSGFTRDADVGRLLQKAGVEFISKPFRQAELAQKINTVLGVVVTGR